MREEGFDDAPIFWLNVHTDAIWRACRIVLDVRMHRGELTVDEATASSSSNTSFEEANARAEVLRYTYTPTYQLSYLLGKVLLLQLREDEQPAPGFRVQPARLPRHAPAERQPADQLPSAPARRGRGRRTVGARGAGDGARGPDLTGADRTVRRARRQPAGRRPPAALPRPPAPAAPTPTQGRSRCS